MTNSHLVPPGSTVLVTGATGFIGSHCVKELVQQGYKVKVTSRSNKKFELLAASLEDSDALVNCIVDDILNYDQMVNAVKGCDGVLHLASPISYSAKNFAEELLRPALEGTTTIMKACLQEPRIKRIVLTSSFAAIYDASKGIQAGVVLDETEFSPLTWEDGANAKDVGTAYRASKTISEKAAWDFIKNEQCHFDLVALCPTLVLGPLLSTKLFTSFDQLNLSNSAVWSISTSKEIPPTNAPLFVDVRDLAFAEVAALNCKEASNQRYMISAGDFDNQEIADILREDLDDVEFKSQVPVGEPGKRLAGTHFTTDSSKAIRDLGMTFRPLKDSILDLYEQLIPLYRKSIGE